MNLTRDPDWRLVVFLGLLCLLLWLGVALADKEATGPKTPPLPANEATRCVCEWPANGAAEGETLEQRERRLTTALRLTRAERAVNRGRRK